jgi:hypothetical protein
MVVLSCHPSYMGSINRRIVVQAGLAINVRLCPKNKIKKVAGVWLKVIRCLPSKHKA